LELDELVERHGIVMWRPLATFCRGALASVHQDGSSDQFDELERAIAEFRTIGYVGRILPYYIGALAEAYLRHGHLEKAEDTIREGLECATTQHERWTLPELLRIQASIAVVRGQLDDAETLLAKAIAIAEEIGALSWQLRASNDLARLWQAQSRTADASRVLQPVYDAFTEGFETRDLVIAAKLLAELR
jgi:predicted ATPase